jgi:hypothetical protein
MFSEMFSFALKLSSFGSFASAELASNYTNGTAKAQESTTLK